jgi:hypothetical protein
VSGDRDAGRRHERPGDAQPDHGAGRRPEPRPADVHAAVEQDDDERDRDHAFDGVNRYVRE